MLDEDLTRVDVYKNARKIRALAIPIQDNLKSFVDLIRKALSLKSEENITLYFKEQNLNKSLTADAPVNATEKELNEIRKERLEKDYTLIENETLYQISKFSKNYKVNYEKTNEQNKLDMNLEMSSEQILHDSLHDKYNCILCSNNISIFPYYCLSCKNIICEKCFLDFYYLNEGINDKKISIKDGDSEIYDCPFCGCEKKTYKIEVINKMKNSIEKMKYLIAERESKFTDCPKHKNDFLQYFCVDCKEAICGTCNIISKFVHKNHRLLNYNDYVKKNNFEKMFIKKNIENKKFINDNIKILDKNKKVFSDLKNKIGNIKGKELLIKEIDDIIYSIDRNLKKLNDVKFEENDYFSKEYIKIENNFKFGENKINDKQYIKILSKLTLPHIKFEIINIDNYNTNIENENFLNIKKEINKIYKYETINHKGETKVIIGDNLYLFRGYIDLYNEPNGLGFIYTLENVLKFQVLYENNKLNNFFKEFNNNEICIYKGYFKDGKRNGFGIEYYQNGNVKFKGYYKNGKKNGYFTEYFDSKNDNIKDENFRGYYKDGKKDGYCEIEGKYKGYFKENKKENYWSIYNNQDSLIYEGSFKDDYRNGFGIEYKNDIKIYKGFFKNNIYNGQGILYENNIRIYQGNFKNGKRHGYGVIFKDGLIIKFKGNFNEGKKQGFGIQYYDNGEEENNGIYKNNEFVFGYYYNKDNEKYRKIFEGTFKIKNNYVIGEGIITGRGEIYKGEFKNFEKHGFGELKKKNGEIIEGKFENGVLIENYSIKKLKV